MGIGARQRGEQGFTLPELLVAGVFMLVFIAVLLLIIRPNDYAVERRNAERRLELAQIMQAITQYKTDKGTLPPNLPTDQVPIATDEEGDAGLCGDLVPAYLTDLPHDPADDGSISVSDNCASDAQFYVTGYTMHLENAGHVVLTAPLAENNETIKIERQFPLL